MSDLGAILASLGLEQYHDALISEGFDTWESVQDITENDLEALNFKLGHRRKLQRLIASQRGLHIDQPLVSSYPEGSGDRGPEGSISTVGDVQGERNAVPTETKRKYRRHPKPDENAPERPPSAYVLFSNAIREEIKGQDMSFTNIAKLVGQRWQSLTAAEREPYESRAASLKEAFNQQFNEYKKSDSYKEYVQYLAEFKAKHGGGSADGKRPKLEDETSGGSTGSPTVPTLSSLSSMKSPEISEAPQPTADSERSRLGPGSPMGAISGAPQVPSMFESRAHPTIMEPLASLAGRGREVSHVPSLSGPSSSQRESEDYFDLSVKPPKSGSAPTHPVLGLSSHAETGASGRPPTKPPLFHSDTQISSVSSIPSTLSYGSNSTAPSLPPTTPRDEPWTPRPDQYTPQKSPWDVPRPIHPPFNSPQGSRLAGIQSFKMSDHAYPHPTEPVMRLPRPGSTSANPLPHETLPLSMRPQTLPPPTFSEHRAPVTQNPEHEAIPPAAERTGEGIDSPLDLLARAVDAQHPQRRHP